VKLQAGWRGCNGYPDNRRSTRMSVQRERGAQSGYFNLLDLSLRLPVAVEPARKTPLHILEEALT
jgi:hypothetical protein